MFNVFPDLRNLVIKIFFDESVNICLIRRLLSTKISLIISSSKVLSPTGYFKFLIPSSKTFSLIY